MRKALLALALLAASAAPSFAGYKGCGISIMGAWSMTNTDTSVDVAGTRLLSMDGLGSDEALPGMGLDCAIKMGNVVAMVFGEYQIGDQSSTVTLLPGTLPAALDLNLGDRWSVGGRLGYLWTPSTLVYGVLAYTHRDAEFSSPLANMLLGPANFGVDDFKGITIGAGIETQLVGDFHLALEALYTKFDSQRVDLGAAYGTPGLVNMNLETDELVGKARLTYRHSFF